MVNVATGSPRRRTRRPTGSPLGGGPGSARCVAEHRREDRPDGEDHRGLGLLRRSSAAAQVVPVPPEERAVEGRRDHDALVLLQRVELAAEHDVDLALAAGVQRAPAAEEPRWRGGDAELGGPHDGGQPLERVGSLGHEEVDALVERTIDRDPVAKAFFTDNNRGFLQGADMLDTSLTLTTADSHWRFSIYGRNLLNEVTIGGDTLLPAAFGGVGASLSPLNKGRVIGGEIAVTF